MGFFGGKKAKDKAREPEREAPEQAKSNKSRRIVPSRPSGSGPAAATAKTDTRSAVVRPGQARPTGKAATGTDSGRVQEQREAAQAPVGAPPRPAAAEHNDGEIKTPARPKSREPIIAGQSEPPKFAGALNLGSARKGGGPCRTGDDALLEFLQSKASLIDEGQATAVRGKADQDSLPIDVAAVQLGFITEDQMVNALTQECWVPHLKVDKYEIRKKALDTIAREDAMHYGVFPVDKLGSLLTLAMVNPLDAETIRVLEAKTSLDIKKVVATRSEITQGIEKYYSGQVQVNETSRSFTQDIEPKSVTQMMSKVAAPPSPSQGSPSRPLPAVMHQAPPAPADNIVSEIQDIDDLLSSDEAIAPAIIEPISLKADAEIIPLEAISPAPQFSEAVELKPIVEAPMVVSSPLAAQPGDLSFEDALPAAELAEPVLTRKVPPAAAPAKQPVPAPEFELGDAPISAPPKPAPVSAPRAPAASPAAPPAHVAPAARAAAPPATPPGPAPAAKSGPSATSRFVGTGRTEKTGVVNLIPVMEEEFQHAITHGKSHVFDKWIGLQSRNRIINAQPVDAEMDTLLAGLYASPRQV